MDVYSRLTALTDALERLSFVRWRLEGDVYFISFQFCLLMVYLFAHHLQTTGQGMTPC